MKRSVAAVFLGLAAASLAGRAEFLFAPTDPTDNGFFTPTISYVDGKYEYSAWDIFYAPKGAPNYPDIFAPAGGVWDPETETWKPEQRSSAGFPANPNYNPGNPFAFWDDYNPTITQVKSNTTFIIGPDVSGNIYTFQDKTGYQLHQATAWAESESLQTVIFQFQTDGTNVDFAKIRLGYMGSDGNTHYLGVNDLQTEYLREYSTTGSDHWSATAGYRNRVLFQWDLSGVEGTGEFWIEWESLSSSMSFQKADLLTASYYEVGMPVSSTWVGGEGEWSDASNWQGQAGSVPLENGNLKFKNTAAVRVDIDDADHHVGEIIFENAADAVIGSGSDHKLIANTGVTTRSTEPDAEHRVYTFDADYELGALNFFEINTGTVVMNGDISGGYGLVKLGAGTLEFNGANTFTGFLAVQGGTLRLNGTNAYTGSTTVVNGRVIMASSGAFGGGTSALGIGGDADLYAFTTGASSWLAELFIEGDLVLDRNISLGAGDLGKRLGAFHAAGGAEFSGNISFSGVVANPDAPGGASAVGNTSLTAQAATDRLIFSGQMTGGSSTKTVTLDGLGTVVYSGADKTYGNSTLVSSGAFLIAEGTALAGAGHVTVSSGAGLYVEGSLTTSGNVNLNGGTLRVDGLLEGAGSFAFNGGILTGSGTVNRAISLNAGDVISPGNSPGSMDTVSQIWGGGGVYLWEIASSEAGAGVGWDLLNITGTLEISATSGSPFEIRITSLDFSHLAGAVGDFDELADYSWVIATASEGIEGFDSSYFSINTDGFANEFTGAFQLSASGGNLVLSYTAVPEPSVWLLLVLGGLFLVWNLRGRMSPLPLPSQSPAGSLQPGDSTISVIHE